MSANNAYKNDERLSSPGCHLASYATDENCSVGRRFSETPCASRSEFQRDRDRIIHSTAFRRLEYKTQVFINHEGDLYRTRLTHTLEVAQIARSIARALQLNEDLTEAIALAHDLGHTAFGHAGQDALHDCMQAYGGFEHNFQSLRVVDRLEEKYPDFDGLNLMFDTREGILKHCSVKNARGMGELGKRFIQRTQPSLEAQLTNIADEIAYNNHDVDDGLRSGLITIEQLREVALFNDHYEIINQRFSEITDKRKTHETIRQNKSMKLVTDLISNTSQSLNENQIKSIEDVSQSEQAHLFHFSDSIKHKNLALKTFLNKNLYQHRKVVETSNQAKRTITLLFDELFKNPKLLPKEHFSKAEVKQKIKGDSGLARVVADYIAGMTDRYAQTEVTRISEGVK